MPLGQKMRDLAHSLVASEAETSANSLQTEPATARVYEKLRRQLGAPVGADGFHALASRALALAKAESSGLNAVQLAANGVVRGLGAVESQADADEDGEAGVNFIAQLLGLFLTFLGEATTLRLLEDIRLQADDNTELATNLADTTDPEVQKMVLSAAFGDLMLEIDRLRTCFIACDEELPGT